MRISYVAIIASLVNMRAEKETAAAVAWRDYASHISIPLHCLKIMELLKSSHVKRKELIMHIIASVILRPPQ